MIEKYTSNFDAGLKGLKYNDLRTTTGTSPEAIQEVYKELQSEITTRKDQIGQRAFEAASVAGYALPNDAFQLRPALIDEKTDETYGSVQLATVLTFHPHVVQDRTGFGHLSEEFDVELPPVKRFKEITTYIIPRKKAQLDNLTALGEHTRGLEVATEPLELPKLHASRPDLKDLHNELDRLKGVNDLVEGTAVSLRVSTWTATPRPLYRNYTPHSHR
jgi:hypothetical protein